MGSISRDSRDSRDGSGKKDVFIPHFIPIDQKIKLWNSQYPKESELADKVTSLLRYAHQLEPIMIGQPLALRQMLASREDSCQVKRVREGVDAWIKLKAFLQTTGEKIFGRYRQNLEYLTDGEFDAHKAWVFSMKGSGRHINEAYRNLATVIGSLQTQGYGPSQFESRNQAARAAIVRQRYNDLLSMKLGLTG